MVQQQLPSGEEKPMTASAFGLNERAFRFALEYFADPKHNETQAAIRAGYSPKSAAVTGCRLLKNANVRLVCARLREEYDRKYELDIMGQYEVLHELTEIARNSDIGNLLLDENGNVVDEFESVSIKRAKQQKKSKFIKKAKIITTQGMGVGADGEPVETMTTTLEVEMYSRHEALIALGKHYQLFTEPQSSAVVNAAIQVNVHYDLKDGNDAKR